MCESVCVGESHLQCGEHQSQLSMLNVGIHQIFYQTDLGSQVPDPGEQSSKNMFSHLQRLLTTPRLYIVIKPKPANRLITVCVCVGVNKPRPEHHIEEEREQVIHAPQEVAIQHRFYFLGQLLKRLLDDEEFV